MNTKIYAKNNSVNYSAKRIYFAAKVRTDMLKLRKIMKHAVCVPVDSTFTVINKNQQK